MTSWPALRSTTSRWPPAHPTRQFLKLAGLAEDGGHARELIEAAEVQVNGRVDPKGSAVARRDIVAVQGAEPDRSSASPVPATAPPPRPPRPTPGGRPGRGGPRPSRSCGCARPHRGSPRRGRSAVARSTGPSRRDFSVPPANISPISPTSVIGAGAISRIRGTGRPVASCRTRAPRAPASDGLAMSAGPTANRALRSLVPNMITRTSTGEWVPSTIGSAASPDRWPPSIGSGCTVVRPGRPSSRTRHDGPRAAARTPGHRTSGP